MMVHAVAAAAERREKFERNSTAYSGAVLYCSTYYLLLVGLNEAARGRRCIIIRSAA